MKLAAIAFVSAIVLQAGWYTPAPVIAPDPFQQFTIILPDYYFFFQAELKYLEEQPKQIVTPEDLYMAGYPAQALYSEPPVIVATPEPGTAVLMFTGFLFLVLIIAAIHESLD